MSQQALQQDTPDVAKLAAERTLQDAIKARAQAEMEATRAEVEALKARAGLGLAPGSTATGPSTTISSGAAAFEASLLAARQLEEAAHRIVRRLREKGLDPERKSFILFAGTKRADFADRDLF